VVCVFVLALAVRLLYLYQIREVGFVGQPASDAFVFVERARGIAAGDWLGPADFVHAPLYAYLLGVIRLLGGEVWAPRVVQCLFGAAACALLVLIGGGLVGRRSGVVAGVLLAVYPPAIFFDGLIQKTSLALLLSVLLLWWLLHDPPPRRWWRPAVAGLTLGLLALTRQNALALTPLVLAWLWLSASGASSGVRARRVVACAMTLAATLLPWALRNRAVIGDFVLTTPNLGQNFAMGNFGGATGTYYEFQRGTGRAEVEQEAWTRTVERSLGRTPTPQEVSDHYLDQALAWIRGNPGAWLRLMAKKWLMAWNAYEAFDTEDYYLYRERSSILGMLDRVFHFGVLAPLAAAGVVLTWRRWRELWLLYGWLVITALAVAVFVVFARYRFPLIPVLILLAAMALDEGWRRLRERRGRSLWGAAVALVAAAVLTNRTIDHPRCPDAVSYTNHALVLRRARRYDDALAELRRALAVSPDHVNANLVTCNTLSEMGRHGEALPFCQRVCSLAPGYSPGYRGLGDVFLGLRQMDGALEMYQRALAADPDDYRARSMLASAYARLGRIGRAVQLFDQVLAVAPDYPEAHVNLGNTYLLVGRFDDAAAAYRRALELDPDLLDALHNLGVVELERGNLDQAIRFFEQTLARDPQHPSARRNLADARAARGR